jgi:hypothetical protein
MKKIMTAVFALSALFAASGKAHAEVNYPWCIIGDTRAVDCYFSSREQCMQDGRNRGFGSQCIKDPYYKPGIPTVPGEKREMARPLRAVSGAHQRECIPTTVYVGSEVSKVCSGASEAGPTCRGWRVECRPAPSAVKP